MMGLLKALLLKITAGWGGYAATAVVATALTGGSIVVMADSGVINLTSGLGQQVQLPFTFKPAALGTLDEVYGSLTAGAAAALTGAGIQLPQIALSGKISAVSNKIVAEANADKAALDRLAKAAAELQGFKSSDDAKALTPTVSATVPVQTATVGTTATLEAATVTSTPTVASTATPTATPSRTATQTATGTPTLTETATLTPTTTVTVTPTETATVTETPTITPTATPTPLIQVSNAGQTLITLSNMIPGGPGVTKSVDVKNIGLNGFTNYTISGSCVAPCNALWSSTSFGLQMAVDRGAPRNPILPAVRAGSALYPADGRAGAPISDLATVTINAGPLGAGSTDHLSVTVWLPGGTPPAGLNALTPNPGNDLQTLTQTIVFNWTASG
jgi:hypothetical protein